jgi:hypothetical protein
MDSSFTAQERERERERERELYVCARARPRAWFLFCFRDFITLFFHIFFPLLTRGSLSALPLLFTPDELYSLSEKKYLGHYWKPPLLQ